MRQFAINTMIYGGSALMAYTIFRYVRFSRLVRSYGSWERERRLFGIPILLLVLFLAGYLVVGLFGKPDLVTAGILFGGSVFVLVMLLFLQRALDHIHENERLAAKLSAAEEASKAKTFFLSNMSHDIRTPLNAIIGYTTLASGANVTPEEKTAYLGKIEKAGRQLLDIVNDVLEMSRIESGRIDPEPIRTDLEACVREAGDLVRTQLSTKGIDFTLSCDIAHRWVLCDRNLLNRALMNLLCNAGKFTGEGGSVSLRLTERPGGDETGEYEIRVADTGIGMSREFLEHVFSPFERERTSTVSRIQGTGLGMAITKSIVDMMGGDIAVDSEQGRGTVFTIVLPLPIVDDAPESADADASPRFDGVRALLVEDNAINLEIARMLLTQAGFDIDTAENGRQAVDAVTAAGPGRYDVILMDIQMPVMDGYAATRAIRALPDAALARTPIIAMTANAFQEDVRATQDAGMNAHIAKPLDVQAMMATLQEVLKGRA